MSEFELKEDTEKKAATFMGWGKLGALALAISAPMFYLNGKAYHEGYLSYLHLEPSMFPLLATEYVEQTAVGWFRVIVGWFNNGFDTLGKNWLLASMSMVVLSLIFGLVDFMTDRTGCDDRKSHKPKEEKRSFFKSWRRVALFLFVSSYGVFIILCLISTSLAMLIMPFVDAGRETARGDVERGFSDAPIVTLKLPGSDEATQFRIIQCADKFCGLFANGRAYTVPVSAVTWAVSDMPGVKTKM
ncbi:hypothetical protein [Pseudomonas syringae]|uniref:hypothetical protein n=1 Tax=Pseudomonas syringae TaxID=317 RepID=UPI0007EE9091|nr:hypothetical protein [Pseudomonas syringae]OBS35391.1 hypothetical protein A9K81_08195 [Pseudomonas syringae pv. syringae]UZS62134.1 hypothetical protein OQB64_23580 [Pseudomonas syringae]